ncbi:MAG: nuclear transport factor 2 family protein [Nocardioides sp.]
MVRDAVDVIERWHAAVNARDVPGVLALCQPDVEVGGPRGVAQGHDVMAAWLRRSGISLEPQEPLVAPAGRCLVRELARWRTTEDAPVQAPTEEPVETWVVFEVTDGLISAVRRYDTRDEVSD